MDNGLVKLIKCFLENYDKESGTANRAAIKKYSVLPNILEHIYGNGYENIVTKVGIGAGSLAKCPYIIFMDSRITNTPTIGIYVVIIFQEDMGGFYLMINQGVTFLQCSDEAFQGIRQFWCSKLGKMPEEVQIKLASRPTRLVFDYQRAYIKAERFDRDFEINIFLNRLKEYLDDYENISQIIREEFQSDIERMYRVITGEVENNSALAVAQLKENKKAKSSQALLDEFISDLKKDIDRTKGVVFFLGAGVSCALGVPDWNTLVFELLQAKWDFQVSGMSQEGIKEYVKQYSSPTALAAMVKNQYKEDGQFVEDIHHIFYKKKNNENELLNSPVGKIARKITARSTGVKAVVTYNFDDFLERAMDAIDCSKEYEVICEGSVNKIYQGNKLPIYHIHGYIPQCSHKETKSDIVFTEKEYHELYSDFYNWTNIIQTKYLMDYTCIFLGLSFSDPNQRRILENVVPFIPDDRFHYLIIGNTVPSEEKMRQCDKELNLLNSAWNEKNYKLKTYYIDGKDYNEVNDTLMSILDMI